jgi:hypothetical protein
MMSPPFTRRELLSAVAAAAAMPVPRISFASTLAAAAQVTLEGPWHYASLADIARRIEAGQLSPTALARQMLDRIAAVDVTLHSYVTVTADHAIASAERAEREIREGRYRGPLHGVPIGVKDLCYTKGVRTMAGTTVLADFLPDVDSTVVARLEAAGAVILGKLTLCEGAFGPYHPELPSSPAPMRRRDRTLRASCAFLPQPLLMRTHHLLSGAVRSCTPYTPLRDGLTPLRQVP